MRVVISIVNYNTEELTKQCLESIFSTKNKNDYEVWVVDNASTDGSVNMIKEFKRVRLIENNANLGFGAAHNIVLKKADAPYLLILNSDCQVGEDVLDNMVTFMEKNPEAAITSCKILGFDGKLQPSAGDLPLGLALFSWLFNLEVLGINKSFHRNEPEYYKGVHEVGWVSGNFMLIRSSVIKKIGCFNERFFMYFEDTEYCYRAKKAGYQIMINPEVSIKHLSGGSLDDPKLRQWGGEYKGLVLFYNQYNGVLAGLFIKILVYISVFLRIIIYGLNGKLNYSNTYAKIIFSI